MATKPPPSNDATMMITSSMILPLMREPPPVPAGQQPPAPARPANPDATMIFTPDMIVNDASVVMGRSQIERALAVVGLWHVALSKGEIGTLLATSTEDVEVMGPRRHARGKAALQDWFLRSGLIALPRRWYCGNEGHVVVEQQAHWRERDGELSGVIASAFIVHDGLIQRYEWFDELQTALTMYGLRDIHEVTQRR